MGDQTLAGRFRERLARLHRTDLIEKLDQLQGGA
jgi:hypothetical protein